jgi:hypothetical protein
MSVMDGKKSGVRFTIQFSRNDPAHLLVANILKSKARGDKAKYIANAVLYYESHGVASDLKHVTLIDVKDLESTICRILQERGINGTLPVSPPLNPLNQIDVQRESVENASHDELEALGAVGLSSIANTMTMFKKMK